MGKPARAFHELSPSTQRIYEGSRSRVPSPRLRGAARLYASGAVKTKKEAAEAFDLDPIYFYHMTSPQIGNETLRHIHDDIDEAIQDETINMSRVLELLGRKAIGKLYGLMRDGQSEILQFKAAQDLADRSPETSKTLKIQSASITISGADAKELAESLVMSAKARTRFREAAEGDFVRVDTDKLVEASDARTHSERAHKEPEGSSGQRVEDRQEATKA